LKYLLLRSFFCSFYSVNTPPSKKRDASQISADIAATLAFASSSSAKRDSSRPRKKAKQGELGFSKQASKKQVKQEAPEEQQKQSKAKEVIVLDDEIVEEKKEEPKKKKVKIDSQEIKKAAVLARADSLYWDECSDVEVILRKFDVDQKSALSAFLLLF
jgi:hypothetical protein